MVLSKLIFGGTLFFLCIFYFSIHSKYINLIPNHENDYLEIASVKQEKTTLEKSIAKGKEVYTDFCMQCHLANGKGDSKNIPPLDGSDWLKSNITQSIHAIKFGQTGEILVNGKKFNNTMPPMGLSNKEVVDVLNYIRNSWSNKHRKMINLGQVEKVKL